MLTDEECVRFKYKLFPLCRDACLVIVRLDLNVFTKYFLFTAVCLGVRALFIYCQISPPLTGFVPRPRPQTSLIYSEPTNPRVCACERDECYAISDRCSQLAAVHWQDYYTLPLGVCIMAILKPRCLSNLLVAIVTCFPAFISPPPSLHENGFEPVEISPRARTNSAPGQKKKTRPPKLLYIWEKIEKTRPKNKEKMLQKSVINYVQHL